MSSYLPFHALRAEAEAWPLASEASFRLASRHLARDQVRAATLDKPTAQLAAPLEECLQRLSSQSLEILQQIRTQAWFLDEFPGLSVTQFTVALAHRYLERAGHTTRLRDALELPEWTGRWRWLSLRVPPDLLVAAVWAQCRDEPPGEDVTLVTPQLAEILKDPVAETHLHLGAALPFSWLWTHLVRAIAHDAPDIRELEKSGAPLFGSGSAMRNKWLAAALVRILLAGFLWRHELRGEPKTFADYLKNEIAPLQDRTNWEFGAPDVCRIVESAFAELRGQTNSFSFARTQMFYRRLIGPAPVLSYQTLHDVVQNDPMSAWLPWRLGHSLPETRFASRALRYLLHEGAQDDAFAWAFWQVQRVRGFFYRHLTQAPGTAGLDWFFRHYQRIGTLRKSLKPILGQAALALESKDVHLASLEARVGADASWTDFRDELRAFARASIQHSKALPSGASPPETGVLVHFIKERDVRVAGKSYAHADPRLQGWRYGYWFSKRYKEALAITSTLRRDPELLVIFRGMDVASMELAIPTWVLVPLFQALRDAGLETSKRLAHRFPRYRVNPLRATCHVGEDYRRLAEGTRRIHEPIEFGMLQTGDRLGHALALADDPRCREETRQPISQPVEDRLDDLVWELDRYGRSDFHGHGSRIEYVRAEALSLAREMYGMRVDADTLIRARRLRHDPQQLRRWGFPYYATRPFQFTDPVDEVLWAYLTEADVFERGRRMIDVQANDAEVEFLLTAQQWLRKLLGRLEMTVEANPSSNLLIGAMPKLEMHPLLRLQPLVTNTETPVFADVLASINADDPLTFATCLADEYAYLYGALLRHGVEARKGLRWLDRLRQNGFHSRFTLPSSADMSVLETLVPSSPRPT